MIHVQTWKNCHKQGEHWHWPHRPFKQHLWTSCPLHCYHDHATQHLDYNGRLNVECATKANLNASSKGETFQNFIRYTLNAYIRSPKLPLLILILPNLLAIDTNPPASCPLWYCENLNVRLGGGKSE